MPFISGIEAARQIKSDFPSIKVIFLTGYDDFEYARQGIEINVNRYILKPISADTLVEILADMRNTLDNELKYSNNTTMLKKLYSEYKQISESLFINSLLLNGDIDSSTASRVESLDLGWLRGDLFCVSVIQPDFFRDKVPNHLEPDLLNFAIYDIANGLVKQSDLGAAVLVDNRVAMLFCASGDQRQTFRERVKICVTEVAASVGKNLNIELRSGIGCVYYNYNDVGKSYREALIAKEYSYVNFDGKIILFEEINPRANNRNLGLRTLSDVKLTYFIRLNSIKAVKNEIERLLSLIKTENANLAKIFIMNAIFITYLEIGYVDLDIQKIVNFDRLSKSVDAGDTNGIRGIMTEACVRLLKDDSIIESKSVDSLLDSAKRIIREQYYDNNLSSEAVSRILKISSSYLRAIFRRDSDVSFIKFLTQIRMEESKKLILSSDLRIYEIAESVGFNDPHYFSYCFKRYFDIWPNDMRKNTSAWRRRNDQY
jgi:two-component system response regulator YesN